MAKLDDLSIKNLKNSLNNCSSKIILSCYQKTDGEGLAKSLEGTLGYLDWCLDGQISKLLKCEGMKSGELTLISGKNKLGKQSSLLIYTAKKSDIDAQRIAKALRGLQVENLSIAQSTFPKDSLGSLEKALKKEQIEWQSLEMVH